MRKNFFKKEIVEILAYMRFIEKNSFILQKKSEKIAVEVFPFLKIYVIMYG